MLQNQLKAVNCIVFQCFFTVFLSFFQRLCIVYNNIHQNVDHKLMQKIQGKQCGLS